MALLDSELIDALGWEKIGGREFRKALTHYLRYMREDEEDNIGLAYEVARQINHRFADAETLAELLAACGHKTVLNLFWFGIKQMAIGKVDWRSRDSDPVPQLVLDFFADHFRVCGSCYRLALRRIRKVSEGIEGFLRLFPPRVKPKTN